MGKPKITVIGAGDVGAAVSRRLALDPAGELVVVDLDGGIGAALDGSAAVAAADDERTAGSSLLVVAVGAVPGSIVEVVKDAVSRAVRKSRDSIIVMVTDPIDVLCEAARGTSGFPRERVVGAAPALDPALARVSGTGETGAGAALDRPAAAAAIVDAVVNDRKTILPCFAYLEGEYGVSGTFLAVPAAIGAGGVEGVVEIELTAEERAQLLRSAAAASARASGVGLK